MSADTNGGNGHGRVPVEIMEMHFPPLAETPPPPPPLRRPVWPALILFILTVISTLAVGVEFARSYARNEAPFSGDQNPFAMMIYPLEHPRMLLLGVPFSFNLLGILLAHELGHYFACKLYDIDVSYPYFIPAPTLFGTFGAFIRIRSPITTRRALFDVGLAGPVVGFLIAVPAMAYAIASSKIVPGAQASAPIVFGNPPLMKILISLFHPGVDPNSILLHPVGRAAWMGLFATALNLFPVWQLDGGHIVYSLASQYHRRISIIRHARSTVVRLGRHPAPAFVAVPPSAPGRSLGTTNAVTTPLGRGRARDFSSLLHAVACHKSGRRAGNPHFTAQDSGQARRIHVHNHGGLGNFL